MTFGRVATFATILAVSAVLSVVLVRRDRDRHPSLPRPVLLTRAAVPVPVPVPLRRAPTESPGPASSPSAPEPLSPISSSGPTEDPLTVALCPDGMVLVDGTTCAERERPCAERDPASGACRRYERAECRPGLALRFCVDRYEYPNQEGALPAVMTTFGTARDTCEEEGKRLCRDLEWTLACEGPEGFALPYGDAVDPAACNTGQVREKIHPGELWEASRVSRVLAKVDLRTRSGALDRCVSTFGAYDLTGNVEEWVLGADSEPARRGGTYSDAGASCRALAKSHQASFRMIDTGFRCCRDPLLRVPARRSLDSSSAARTVAPPPRFD